MQSKLSEIDINLNGLKVTVADLPTSVHGILIFATAPESPKLLLLIISSHISSKSIYISLQGPDSAKGEKKSNGPVPPASKPL